MKRTQRQRKIRKTKVVRFPLCERKQPPGALARLMKSMLKVPANQCYVPTKISWEKCLAKAGGDAAIASILYEAASNDGLPGYCLPMDLIED